MDELIKALKEQTASITELVDVMKALVVMLAEDMADEQDPQDILVPKTYLDGTPCP